ncbi:MAG: cation:proton antiporter, partial [Acidimicrobiales bacterium]
MEQSLAIGLAAIILFGVFAQWLAARLRIPSILVLLAAGVLAGPVAGLVEPDELFGETIFPLVSLAVGLLLFEGGLSLRLDGFRQASSTVLRLVTIGALVTWLVAAGAAALLFDLSTEITFLLGAILVVSGPTVVIPLLRQARPQSPIAETLRWEGIVIDPIGAALAVLVLNLALGEDDSWPLIAVDLLLTVVVGVGIGLAAAALLTFAIVRFQVADNLLNPVAILFAVTAFTASNAIIAEAGLFATTTLGIALANQRLAPASAIAHFQEELGPLMLAGLFVVLGAQVDLGDIADVALPSAALALVLVLVARPLVVWLSTLGSGLPWRQRLYLSSLAPRGIVAASVASLFALELERAGVEAGQLVPITFSVIFVTVLIASAVV